MTDTILIVDDDEAFQFYMKSLFKKHPNSKILKAYDGQQALDLISAMAEPPSIIFLDLNMPVMDGHEFLEVWAEKYNFPSTRIVIVSSSDAEQDREKTQQYDCVKDYVVKPEIDEKIDQHMNA